MRNRQEIILAPREERKINRLPKKHKGRWHRWPEVAKFDLGGMEVMTQ